MGSPPTLDPTPSHLPDQNQPPQDHEEADGQAELLAHLQTPAAFGGHEFQDWPVQEVARNLGGDLDRLHTTDHTHLARELRHRHPGRDGVRDAERAFDQLNPDYGVPADRTDRIGHRDVHQRERALALGVRVGVHDSRQNDPDPVIWQPGQDYRAAAAIHTARRELVRARHGPERVGPER
jgi:hypothetical protein